MSSTTATTREQTFLRVKRRRNENPPSTIRLELLGGWNVRRHDENDNNNILTSINSNNTLTLSNSLDNGRAYPLRSSSTGTLADSRHSAFSTSTSQTTNVTSNINTSNGTTRRTTAAAIWKRVEDSEVGDSLVAGEKRCRVLDAVLENDGRSSKRRKLTVLGEAKADDVYNKNNNAVAVKKKQNIYRILDPVTRLVDDSLNMVHAGDRSVSDHYSLITTDPRLATHSRKWLVYRNRGGNLLHACAQWNDVELAHDLLRKSLPGLTDSVDEDGRTPYETAQLCANQSVAEVLEAFGADTTNFVYDMFVPEEIEMETTITPATTSIMDAPLQQRNGQTTDDWNPLEKTPIDSNGHNYNNDNNDNNKSSTGNLFSNGDMMQGSQQAPPDFSLLDASRLLELQGGVGYWTEDGELILEMEQHLMMGITTEYEHDIEDEFGEDDIDSNCEDYGGNDYPDEDESWEEEFLHEEPQIEGGDGDSSVHDEDDRDLDGYDGNDHDEW